MNQIKTCLQKYFKEIGVPNTCILDNTTCFKKSRFQKFCEKNTILLKCANPTERYIKEVTKFF